MPFAKVGAMPQPTTSTKTYTNNGRGSKSNRPKGITMEDLKKQTARRLAQEQNLVNGDLSQPGSHSIGVVPVVASPLPLPSQQPYHHVPHRGQPYPQDDVYRGDGYTDNRHSHLSSHHQQQMMANPQYHPHTPAMRTPPIDRISPQQQQTPPPHYAAPSPNLVQQHPGGYAASNYGSYANAIGISQENNMRRGPGDYSPNFNGMASSVPGPYNCAELIQTTSSSSFATAANAAKNKLPHGLTVHELKEMTKARLQAEAAEKMDGELQRERGVSPLDFDVASTGGGARERALSRDSTCRSNSVYHQTGVVGVPHVVDGFARPTVQSPTLRQVNRTDTWDSASVASYNSNVFSENLGSESALDVSYELGSNRTRSFTVPTLPSAEESVSKGSWSNPAQPSRGTIGTPRFDAAVGGNRRRAVTLSPGTGLIMEDRPHHGTWTGDRLQLPSFGSSVGTSSSVHARQRVYSPVLEQLGLDGPFARERSSTDSAIGSNLFGSSTLSDFQSTSLSSSEFTRESSGAESRVPAPPPGFPNSDGNDTAAINRDRLTTFSPHEPVHEAFLGGDKNPWGSDPRRRLATVEALSTDLGSILNLSGSDRRDRDRANTYTFGSALPMSIPDNGENATDASNGMDAFRY